MYYLKFLMFVVLFNIKACALFKNQSYMQIQKIGLVATQLAFVLCLNAQIRNKQHVVISQTDSLDEVVVTSTRIGTSQTLTAEDYTPKKLEAKNNGVNLPYLLTTTPSLVVTSDDGLGVGYTYFRVRGTDQSRINMTINGVPLNDPESQTVFWVDMTDMASSMSNVQVQRGVGTSTNGAAAFGASVNMQTEKTSTEPYAQMSFNGGMYNTFRESAKFGTGLMKNGFAFDARFSKVNSDGYLDRAFSNLYSYYASGAWYGANTMVKFMAFGGAEKTYMAWDGIDYETLKINPRFNPAGMYKDDNGDTAYYKNQTDNYWQNHYQLHVSHVFNAHWNANAALHYTYGYGYYEMYKVNKKFADFGLDNYVDTVGNTVKRSDLINRKYLRNDFYGGILGLNYSNKNLKATLGGALNNYIGDHYGDVLWVRNYNQGIPKDYEYYRNQGRKLDGNIYAKANWQLTDELSLYGDMQYRHIHYTIDGVNDEDLQPLEIDKYFDFFNPKAGIHYSKNGNLAYATFAVANREPNRDNYKESGANEAPTSERLYDYELGYQRSAKIYSAGVNLYYMKYDNQLVLTGKYSDTGAYLTENVKDSYRSGMEILFGIQPVNWMRWDANMTLSRNKILNYSDWVDDYDADWNDPQVVASEGQVKVDYGTTNIAFSPNITAMSNLQFMIGGFNVALQTNYVGKQYLDNTGSDNAKLDPYCVSNFRLAYSLPHVKAVRGITFNVLINNLFNVHYASNGGSYSYFEGADGNYVQANQHYTPWYYAQAGFNIHAGVVVDF